MNNNDEWFLLAQGQGIYYMHQASVLVDHCIVDHKYEQNQLIYHHNITTNMQNLWKNCHNYSNLAQDQILLYMHQQHIIPDYSTIYKLNELIFSWDITTNTQNVWQNGNNYSNLALSQIQFFGATAVPDYGI